MNKKRKAQKILAILFIALQSIASITMARETCDGRINLLPKYGPDEKCQNLVDGDNKFIEIMDKQFNGNRMEASKQLATRGWDYLLQGNIDTAMRRFNQAWLLDPSNPVALWGMGAIMSDKAAHREAISLLNEARPFLTQDFRFKVDYARMLAMAGIHLKEDQLIDAALSEFSRLYNESPQDVNNLQNWAITLYSLDQYEDAWEKIKEAKKMPDAHKLSSDFVSELLRIIPKKNE
jgi:tetratricopeptide (TPR) repeat protein